MAGPISESMKSAVEARLEEVYGEIGYRYSNTSSGCRPHMSKCADEDCEDCYSDISSDDSQADLMKESKSITSAAETTDRSTFTGSVRDIGGMRETFHSTVSRSDAPSGDHKKRFGRISNTFASAESARSTWNTVFSSAAARDTDAGVSDISFPECDDYMDLFEDLLEEEMMQVSTGPAVVAGAGSIMKSRQSDGSLPDNPNHQHGEHSRGSSSQVQRGGPASSWEGLWTDPGLQGGPSSSDTGLPGPTTQEVARLRADKQELSESLTQSKQEQGMPPPSSSQAAEWAGGAVPNTSFAARSPFRSFPTSSHTMPRTTVSDHATATGAPLDGVVFSASRRAAGPPAGVEMPRSLPPLPVPPLPPAENSAKSGAYIRRPRPS